MSWKSFKNKIESQGVSETDFILGIDLGNSSSAIAMFGTNRPEVIDLSGGYGKQSIPTVMQYVPDTNEWVFGEYAVLNQGFGNELTIRSIIDKLGLGEYVEIEKKLLGYSDILTLFLKELISNCYSINPKAEIAGIVLAVPEYLSEEAKSELSRSLNRSGYGNALIQFATDNECILSQYYFDKPVEDEKILILDFGNRGMKGSVFEISSGADGIKATSLAYMHSKDLSTELIDQDVEQLFTEYYLQENEGKLTKQVKNLISAFAYQHKDLLFQKKLTDRPTKLYFNFAYPPFQKMVTKEIVEDLIFSYRDKLQNFVSELCDRAYKQNGEVFETIICTGGGFEMLWIREEVKNIFKGSNIVINKYAKGIVAEGASVIAADKLSVIKTNRFNIEDNNKVQVDIGVKVKSNKSDRFIAIIEKNTFWWQKQESKMLIINEETDKPIFIELFKRDENGQITSLDKLQLSGLPNRPKGATKIALDLEFDDYKKLIVTVKDFGFGELFKASDYKENFEVNICELGTI